MANEEKNVAPHTSPLDSIRHESEQYGECWSGKELYKLLVFLSFQYFLESIASRFSKQMNPDHL